LSQQREQPIIAVYAFALAQLAAANKKRAAE
jgi:hypothetical protein